MHRWLIAFVGAAVMLYETLALAGGPEGLVATLDPSTKQFLIDALVQERLLPQANGLTNERIENAISDYLSQNWSEVRSSDFGGSRQVDLAICLLNRHGHHTQEIMNQSTARFCWDHLVPL